MKKIRIILAVSAFAVATTGAFMANASTAALQPCQTQNPNGGAHPECPNPTNVQCCLLNGDIIFKS